jgi:hypothetical protein
VVGNEDIASLVDAWSVVWTALLLVGYLAELTPWPRLRVLRATGVASFMLLSSSAVVLGLVLAERTESAAVLSAWAVVTCSVKLIWDLFQRE